MRSGVHSPYQLRECKETYGITIQKACLSVKGSLTWKGGSCPFGTLALSDAGQPAALDAYASSHIDPSLHSPSAIACYSTIRPIHKIARPFSTDLKGSIAHSCPYTHVICSDLARYGRRSSPAMTMVNHTKHPFRMSREECGEQQSFKASQSSGVKYHHVMQTLILGSIHRIYLIMIKM